MQKKRNFFRNAFLEILPQTLIIVQVHLVPVVFRVQTKLLCIELLDKVPVLVLGAGFELRKLLQLEFKRHLIKKTVQDLLLDVILLQRRYHQKIFPLLTTEHLLDLINHLGLYLA